MGEMRLQIQPRNGQAYRNATRYLWPSFSSSAMTQSVTHGIPRRDQLIGYLSRLDDIWHRGSPSFR